MAVVPICDEGNISHSKVKKKKPASGYVTDQTLRKSVVSTGVLVYIGGCFVLNIYS